MRWIVSALSAAALSVAAAETARAGHKVYSPTVEQGVLEIEARAHRTIDSNPGKDDGQGHKYELGYGLASWWHTTGGRGLVADSFFQRQFRDVHAASSQLLLAWDPNATLYGRVRLGLPANDPRI
jgi:hypothetical protein